ncbi:hypothetical protein MMC32_001126 [Xylographa parallela]|nr:hypothetical protein [Xylographa parallela]
MSEPPMLSKASKDVLAKVRQMVPPMLESFHKGQLGRVAVIGGSQDYTGAPYFSAMASARLGADMSHVICEPEAAQVIKTYSPNLMVHPLMRQTHKLLGSETPDHIISTVVEMLPRLHVLVIGPGLGRDDLMQSTCAAVIAEAKKQDLPFVLDADGLHLVNTDPSIVKGYKQCILTPNVVEFGRLAKAVGVTIPPSDHLKSNQNTDTETCEKVARALGGVLVIQKGAKDIISNGEKTLVCDLEGGRKRSGGQGDTLTGSLGTLLAYRKAYMDKIWDVEGNMSADELLMVAAFGGSAITRECSRLAFQKNGRSLQASDLTENVTVSFENLIGEKTEESKL